MSNLIERPFLISLKILIDHECWNDGVSYDENRCCQPKLGGRARGCEGVGMRSDWNDGGCTVNYRLQSPCVNSILELVIL